MTGAGEKSPLAGRDKTAVATLGGGCFWCVEAVFADVRGVTAVEPGYAGGHTLRPTYEQVCSGETGHAEVVRIAFDPEEISYREILEIFFATHDPTTLNRQGGDVGPQYRSVIFYHDDEQRRVAEETVARLTEERVFDDPIVTQIVPVANYHTAEPMHHEYFKRHPEQGYCRVVIAPKVAAFRRQFAAKLKA